MNGWSVQATIGHMTMAMDASWPMANMVHGQLPLAGGRSVAIVADQSIMRISPVCATRMCILACAMLT